MQKLGLIAGGGGLPVEIAEHCRRSGRALFVVRLKGFAGAELAPYAGAEVGLAELGKCFKALKRAGGKAVCLAGQVNRGLVLAVEAAEGTDAMLTRVAELPEALRGVPGASCGVLAKAPKPIQETRVDLPTIGPATVHAVARAGLSGIVGEAGRLLVL